MQIINNYDGASIDIIKNDEKKNKLFLLPKMEHNSFSNYYNFKVSNKSEKSGLIYIKKNKNTLYSPCDFIPFYRSANQEFIRMNKDNVTTDNDYIIIKIDPNISIEISLYPRYVLEDLKNYENKLKKNKNVFITNDVISKITIGNTNLKTIVITARIHPAETFSSYFLEGIIDTIISNYSNFSNYCFLIFPMVNINGVKNGNHRYYNDLDYNRIWNNNNCQEIEFIKKQLDKHDVVMFIDVHGDEVSKIDYIRSNDKNLKNVITDFMVLDDNSKLKRFIRAIIKQHKVINVFDKTAREYVIKKYNCIGILVELSMLTNDCKVAREKGKKFIKQLTRGDKK